MKKSYLILAVVAIYSIGAFSRAKALLDEKVPLADALKKRSVWGWFFTASEAKGEFLTVDSLTARLKAAADQATADYIAAHPAAPPRA